VEVEKVMEKEMEQAAGLLADTALKARCDPARRAGTPAMEFRLRGRGEQRALAGAHPQEVMAAVEVVVAAAGPRAPLRTWCSRAGAAG
jgi:hypothetical protein